MFQQPLGEYRADAAVETQQGLDVDGEAGATRSDRQVDVQPGQRVVRFEDVPRNSRLFIRITYRRTSSVELESRGWWKSDVAGLFPMISSFCWMLEALMCKELFRCTGSRRLALGHDAQNQSGRSKAGAREIT